MTKLFLAVVMCIPFVGSAAAHSVVREEKPELILTADIIKQSYCEGDDELDGLNLELRLRYQNAGKQRLILYKGSRYVHHVKVSSSLEDAKSIVEVSSSITWVTEGEWPVNESSLDSMFVILAPGETYETNTDTRVFVTRKNVRRRIAGSVSPGDHYLQVTIPTWDGSQELADSLGEKWRKRGSLWTESVTSLPMKFTVDSHRSVASCP